MLGSQSGLAPAAECLGPVSQASRAPLPSLGAPCHAHPHRPQKHALLSLALPADRSLLPPLLVIPSWPCCPVLASRVPLASCLCCVVSTFALTGLTLSLFPQVSGWREQPLGFVVCSLPGGGAPWRPGHARRTNQPSVPSPLLLQDLSCMRQC